MEIPGFELRSFPERPKVLHAARDFDFQVSGEDLRVVLELLLRRDCRRAVVEQGSARRPSFLIRNSGQGLLKPVGAGASKLLRRAIFSFPAGDVFQGCTEAVRELSGVFDSTPLPPATVNARLPVVLAGELEFENKMGSRRPVEGAVFELKPRNFGYMVLTEGGLKRFTGQIERSLQSLSP